MKKENKPLPLLDSLSEADIVKMARDGNKEAFGELMVRWESYIKMSFSKVLSCQSDINDAYQETVLSLMTTIKSMKHNNFQGWLIVAIQRRRNTFLKIVKARGDRLKTGENIENVILYRMGSREDDPGGVCERREMQEDVKAAINQLPKKQKEAVRIYFLNCKTFLETAKELGVSRQAVNRRVLTAKETLRETLSKHKHPKP
ncbi:hypothetical protein LCGC14_1666370 [marine sediment metagenome]|uniref:RNA polymerase sigma factor 70 region 4 type 2 domain-containing protein n=1 Tax=marine sediment metagenome TaxID=412755 RepID=A0A0F9HT90_9ZZZZ